MKIANNITDLIGNTPLIRLNTFSNESGATLLAKLEYQNPGGSVKDRLAWAMIRDAEIQGKITRDTVIIEPTSGNTGIGLAMVCAARGYKLIVTMPENASLERRKLIRAYGSEVLLSPAETGMTGAIKLAVELSTKYPKSFIPQQFKNLSNAEMHRQTTGPEIWRDTDGKVDIFVSGVGTGGTITGAGEYLKSKNPDLYVVAVEPSASPVISGGNPGKHKIAGIGAGFVPDVLNREIIDEIITVNDDDAFETARLLTTNEGVFAGISSGAILWAAMQVAKRPENQGKTVVLITCDTGERYLSTSLYSTEE
jgi:cysteine synthase A